MSGAVVNRDETSRVISPSGPPNAVRGAILTAGRQWAIDHHGQQGFAELVETLPAPDQACWSSRVLGHTELYPASFFRNFGVAVLNRWGQGDLDYLRDPGAYVALRDLSGHMKVLMKLGTPSFVVSRFPRVWSTYFAIGEVTVLDRSSESAVVEIRGANQLGPLAVHGAIGWMQRALKYSGAVECEITLRQFGHRDVYQLQWSTVASGSL